MTQPNGGQPDPAGRVGRNVRLALSWRQIKHNKVAEALGISTAAVSRRLTGETNFDVAEIVAVAGLVGLTVGDLVDRDPWTPPQEVTPAP